MNCNNHEKRITSFNLDVEVLNKFYKKIGYNSRSRIVNQLIEDYVKDRDNKQCTICGSTHKLNSHHILYKSKHPELSLNTNNGITLCHLHHREVHILN